MIIIQDIGNPEELLQLIGVIVANFKFINQWI